jgi:aryl-alcohol dehydrogenase-like predicted oxidoreductase
MSTTFTQRFEARQNGALRPLGSTGLRVSPLGLGLAALGRPGYINLGHAQDLPGRNEKPAMQAQTHAVLDSAWTAGVRYFDTARSYGAAEEFLGSWLVAREIAPEVVTVGSKWGYTYTANWQVQATTHEVKEHSLPVLQRQWQESQSHLGKYLDLYLIHSATLESGVLGNVSVLSMLSQLKSQGIRIGLSLSGTGQAATLRQAMAVQVEGHALFDVVQATWNLLEPAAGPTLQEARERGLGVIIKEALANGRLTERNTEADFAPSRTLLQKEATRLQTSVDALALAAVLARPWVDVVLSGATSVEQLHSNLQAADVVWDEEAEHKLTSLAEPSTEYWQRRAQLDWN